MYPTRAPPVFLSRMIGLQSCRPCRHAGSAVGCRTDIHMHRQISRGCTLSMTQVFPITNTQLFRRMPNHGSTGTDKKIEKQHLSRKDKADVFVTTLSLLRTTNVPSLRSFDVHVESGKRSRYNKPPGYVPLHSLCTWGKSAEARMSCLSG